MDEIDLKPYSNEELNTLLNNVLAEQERRSRLAMVPQQVAQMAAQYVADGGDKTVLVDALADARAADPEVMTQAEEDEFFDELPGEEVQP